VRLKEVLMNTRRVGTEWEEKAVEYLVQNHVSILERNYRCHIGEIDIIGKDGDTYVFVEVKYRKSGHYGYSYEAVTPKKQQTIMKVAQVYLMSRHIPTDVRVRFDVCGFDNLKLTYIKNAF
jgi:putative endonuclease